MKIPFTSRQAPQDLSLSRSGSGPAAAPVAFLVEREQLSIGLRDFVLEADLVRASSELEGSYGLGFPRDSSEALCFLAGGPQFDIDDLELWIVA